MSGRGAEFVLIWYQAYAKKPGPELSDTFSNAEQANPHDFFNLVSSGYSESK